MPIQLPSISFTLDFTEKAHKNQKRKYTDEPYVNHCLNVANNVSGVTDDIEMIYSALLHDTIEDSGTTAKDLEYIFNKNISNIVWGLTNRESQGTRKQRKYNDLCWLMLGNYQVHTIKCADIIDNLSDLEKYDPKFAKIYFKEKKEQLSILTNADKTLYKRAKQIIDDYFERN